MAVAWNKGVTKTGLTKETLERLYNEGKTQKEIAKELSCSQALISLQFTAFGLKARKKEGVFNPFFGKHHTEQTKQIISQKNTGKLAGEKHPNYKDGLRRGHSWGYLRYTNGEYVHRVTMEHFLGRKLYAHEHIHHINGNVTDNRIENLELTTNSKHRSDHAKTQLRGYGSRFVKETANA